LTRKPPPHPALGRRFCNSSMMTGSLPLSSFSFQPKKKTFFLLLLSLRSLTFLFLVAPFPKRCTPRRMRGGPFRGTAPTFFPPNTSPAKKPFFPAVFCQSPRSEIFFCLSVFRPRPKPSSEMFAVYFRCMLVHMLRAEDGYCFFFCNLPMVFRFSTGVLLRLVLNLGRVFGVRPHFPFFFASCAFQPRASLFLC